jgi:rRNA maturation endonuclease Nob1
VGAELTAHCPCGVKSKVYIGGGRASRSDFKLPYACHSCRKTVSINVLASNCICPECGGSNVRSFQASNFGRWAYDFMNAVPFFFQRKFWKGYFKHSPFRYYCSMNRKTYLLLAGSHPCPSCGAVTLEFSLSRLID